ncbi:hypothetical protein SprV_0200695600 [Sparganum proliferum]
MDRRAEGIQWYADHKEWKNFFAAFKSVCGFAGKGTIPLLSADGTTLLTEKMRILKRGAEPFRGVFDRLCTISYAAIARLRQVETNAYLDLSPSLHETIGAMLHLFSGIASGSDVILLRSASRGH